MSDKKQPKSKASKAQLTTPTEAVKAKRADKKGADKKEAVKKTTDKKVIATDLPTTTAPLPTKPLGRKQYETNERFIDVFKNIEAIVPKRDVDNLVDATLEKIKPIVKGKRCGLCWSAGKDSVALEYLMRLGGYELPTCIGMTKELEYPEFLRFVTANMPEGLQVYKTNHDLNWLAANLGMLFPQNSAIAGKWFAMVQHACQAKFFKENKLDVILLGRRKQDCNYVGNGTNIYTSKGVTRYSPLSEWTHEQVIAFMHYHSAPFAPFYSWRNGWVVGSGNWAARQWVGSIENGWRDIYEIDATIVQKASAVIPSAAEYLKSIEHLKNI